MEYTTFRNMKLSRLGFGAMRLPVLEDGHTVDQKQVEQMVDYAIAHGVNYFDTAYPYHDGQSEPALGQALRKYPRESFYIATKFPGHQEGEPFDPAEVFEKQLKRCGVEYFDTYLLHNVNENSVGKYMDPARNILPYFVEQKRLGRIKYLGFSCHGSAKLIEEFLEYCGGAMDFCQIQLNYLDWSLQDAKAKYELLTEKGLAVFVMEPVHGGTLAKLKEPLEQQLKALRPEESIASWAFRYLQRLPNVAVILSGMSNMEQVEDNVKTFSGGAPLTDREVQVLYQVAEELKGGVPCTGCRYCCAGCPVGLDIPFLLNIYNNLQYSKAITVTMRVEGLPPEKRASACIGCGACTLSCPQNIQVPEVMTELSALLEKLPKWTDVCEERGKILRKI